MNKRILNKHISKLGKSQWKQIQVGSLCQYAEGVLIKRLVEYIIRTVEETKTRDMVKSVTTPDLVSLS